MKKRFTHILGKQNKKNGLLMILIVVLLTLLLGSLVACSTSKESNNINDASEALDTSTSDPANENILDSESITITPEPTITNDTTDSLSADAQEIKKVVEEFSKAYFSGDSTTIKTFLTDSYEGNIDVYSETDESTNITDTTLKGLSDIDSKNINDVAVVSLEFRPTSKDDSFKYLTIELIKDSEGWKIYFYGIEG